MRVTWSPINITESSGHDLSRYICFYPLVICEFEFHICFFFHLCSCFLYFVLDFKFWDCFLVRCISHLIDWWACYLHAYVWLNLWMLYVLVCITVLCIVWSIQSDKPRMWVLFTCCGDVDFVICLFISFCVHIVMLDVRVLLVLVRLLSMLCIAA